MSFRALPIVIQHRPLVKSTTGFKFCFCARAENKYFQENRAKRKRERENVMLLLRSGMGRFLLLLSMIYSRPYIFMDIQLTSIMSLTDKVSVSLSIARGWKFMSLSKEWNWVSEQKSFFHELIITFSVHQHFYIFITKKKLWNRGGIIKREYRSQRESWFLSPTVIISLI